VIIANPPLRGFNVIAHGRGLNVELHSCRAGAASRLGAIALRELCAIVRICMFHPKIRDNRSTASLYGLFAQYLPA
jgi:hypothetical protein